MKPSVRQSGRPKLGQHFLIDEAIVERIIALADLPNDATVVEIGPGKGILTRALSAAVPDGQLLAIEVDGTLAHQLRERVSKRVKVIHADALRFDYTTVSSPYHVVSNLPYQISSPILHALIGSANPPASMTVMLQREVAERLIAPPHSRERGLLTVVTEWYGSVERCFDVPPEAFSPPPKVWSSVVKLVRVDSASVTSGDGSAGWRSPTPEVSPALSRPPFQPFVNFLKVGFAQKRRQLHHPFQARFPMLKSDLDELFVAAGVERTQRAEELTFEQWLRLYQVVTARLRDATKESPQTVLQ